MSKGEAKRELAKLERVVEKAEKMGWTRDRINPAVLARIEELRRIAQPAPKGVGSCVSAYTRPVMA